MATQMPFNFTAYEKIAAAMDDETIQCALEDIRQSLELADRLDREDRGDRGGRYRDQASVLRAEAARRAAAHKAAAKDLKEAAEPPAEALEAPAYLVEAMSETERHHFEGIRAGRWARFPASDVVVHLLTIAKLRVDAARYAEAVRKPCGVEGCLGSATHADPYGGVNICRGHRELADAELLALDRRNA